MRSGKTLIILEEIITERYKIGAHYTLIQPKLFITIRYKIASKKSKMSLLSNTQIIGPFKIWSHKIFPRSLSTKYSLSCSLSLSIHHHHHHKTPSTTVDLPSMPQQGTSPSNAAAKSPNHLQQCRSYPTKIAGPLRFRWWGVGHPVGRVLDLQDDTGEILEDFFGLFYGCWADQFFMFL